MPEPSPLARYIDDRLEARGEPIYDFTRRTQINTSGFYKLLRGEYATPSHRTLEKIAHGLGMTAAELLAAAEDDDGADEIEQAIRQRTAEMREVVQDVPRAYWAAIIKAIFDRALDSARDMTQLLRAAELPPVSASPEPRVSASLTPLTPVKNGRDDQLGVCKQGLGRLALSL